MAISSATDANRKLVESVCGVQFLHSLSPVFEQSQWQRIQQQLSPSASINKFEWTGAEDTPEEVERLKLRLQALIGWDEFPSDMELRDVHTQLFNERVEDESHRGEITGEHQLCKRSAAESCSLLTRVNVSKFCCISLFLEVGSAVTV